MGGTMTDFASIGIELDSRPVVEGTRALDALAETSAKVDQKVTVMNGGMNETARIMRASAEAVKTADDASVKFLGNLQREIDLFGASRAETERYKAAAAGLSTETQRAAAALGTKIDAMHRDEKAARDAAAAEDQATKAADRFIKSLQEQVATLDMNRTQLLAYRAAQLGVSDAATPLIAKLSEAGAGASSAGKHMEGLSFQSVGARRELLVLAHELSQGNYQKFGGSMMVLGEQTGAAGLLFSAAGLAALGLTAAVVGLGYALIKGASEQRAMNNALIETGNYAGVTGDQLNSMAHAAVEAGGSIREAKKVVAELAGTGKFTGEQIGYITEAAIAMEHATGKSVEKTIKEFESLAVQTSGNTLRSTEAISRATLKLDDTYHFLTESVYEQIRALEKDGEQKAASALATKTLAEVTDQRAEEMVKSLGYVSRAWHGITEFIGKAVDKAGEWGMTVTPAMEVARLMKEIQQLQDGSYASLHGGRDAYNEATLAAMLAADKVALTKAQTELNKANEAAAAAGARQLAQSEASHAASRIAQDDVRLQKKGMSELQIALNEYAADVAKIKAVNPNSALVTDEAVAAGIAARTKAHTAAQPKARVDQADSTALQDHMARIQNDEALDKQYFDFVMKLDDMRHKAGEIGDAEYYANRREYIDGLSKAELNMYDRQLAALRAHHNSTKEEEAKTAKAINDIVDKREAAKVKASNHGFLSGEEERLRQKAIETASEDAANKYTSDLQRQLEAIEAATGKRQLSKSAIEEETVALYEQAVANMKVQASAPVDEMHTEADRDAAVRMLADLEKQLDLHRQIAEALKDQDDAAASRRLADMAIQDWQRAGSSIADSLSNAFGTGGKAIGQMYKAFAEGQSAQLRAQKELATAKKLADDNPEKLRAIQQAQLAGTQAQLKSYGDMADAAQGFFDQGSKGYAAMHAASQVLHSAEVALSLVKGVNAVLTQGEGDPYSAFARMAAMAALVTGLGVALSGGMGGSDTTVADRQAAQGAGTVLGDGKAKSESISRAIELSAANSSTQIDYLSGMLASLRNIETGISSFASQVVQGGLADGSQVSTSNSGVYNALNSKAAGGLGSVAGAGVGYMAGAGLTAFTSLAALGGPVGLLIGAVAGKFLGSALSSVLGGKQTLEDSGFTMDKSSLGAILASGAKANSYADIKTDGGWFHSDKRNTQLTSLGQDANVQFSLVIESLADSITEAGKLLGVSGAGFESQLDGFVVDIGKVSLKGMTGDEVQKALESVFSKLGDQMASYAIGGLQQFAKVGEGYLETLVRVASDYAKVDASLQSIGKTFGATGLASIAARESLIALMGGIDEFQSQTAGFASNFLSKAEQLAPVAKFVDEQLAALGLTGITTRDQFKQVVLGLDLTTAAGQKEYSALMKLQEAFAATHAATVDLSKTEQEIADERKDLQDQLDQLTMTQVQLLAKQRNALAEVNRPLFDLVQTAQKLADTAINMTKFRDAAKSLNDTMLTGSLSPLTPVQQEAELHSQYEAMKAAAMAGDTKAQDGVFNALTAWLTASQKLNAGDSTYQANFAEGQRDTAAFAAWATNEVDAAQAQLDAMNSQNVALGTVNTALDTANTILTTISQNTAPVAGGANVIGTALSALTSAINALKQDNAKLTEQVAGLRKDQDGQTGDSMQANDDTAQRAAQAIVDGVTQGVSQAVSKLVSKESLFA